MTCETKVANWSIIVVIVYYIIYCKILELAKTWFVASSYIVQIDRECEDVKWNSNTFKTLPYPYHPPSIQTDCFLITLAMAFLPFPS